MQIQDFPLDLKEVLSAILKNFLRTRPKLFKVRIVFCKDGLKKSSQSLWETPVKKRNEVTKN